MVSKLLESRAQYPGIIIFLIEKNILANSSHRKVYSKLKRVGAIKKVDKNLFLLKKTTNEDSTKSWKSFIKYFFLDGSYTKLSNYS